MSIPGIMATLIITGIGLLFAYFVLPVREEDYAGYGAKTGHRHAPPVQPDLAHKIHFLVASAHSGDSEAMIELARMFLNGEGIPKNLKKADSWFRKAADKDHPVGNLYIAYCYQAVGEYQNAFKRFLAAAKNGNTEAMEAAGKYYYFGQGTERNLELAFRYFKVAAERGNRPSAKRLYAQCLLYGQGTEADIETGMIEMRAAAELGDKIAQNIVHMGFALFLEGKDLALEDADMGIHFTDNFCLPASTENTSRTSAGTKKKHKEFIPDSGSVLAQPHYRLEMEEDEQGELIPPAPKRAGLQECMDQLNGLIGLTNVKETIQTYINRMQLHQLRIKNGLPVTPITTHLVFVGNPGTGKTTVARILGNIFREIGFLKKGHVVEVSRADLVGEYVGQTSPLVKKKVSEALDGILFIDEAYSILDNMADGGGYGSEAIATLLKLMEDNRDRLVVIAAGYIKEMDDFINSNPGLKSRFTETIIFEDFTAYQLGEIFESLVEKYGFGMTEKAQLVLEELMRKVLEERDPYFGNARYVRNLFDDVQDNLANRIAKIAAPSKEDLSLIREQDIKPFLNAVS